MAQVFAKFWKCALQVNPWTYAQQYQEQGAAHGLTEDSYNAALADRCVKNEIQVVGIADHGSVDGIEKLRQILEATGIVVFPGFEIASTEKVHMVCLYPVGTSINALNQYLGALGVPVGAKKTDPSTLGCLAIAEKIEKQGGFWYAAHATGASGLLRLQQDGGGLNHIWCDCNKVLAAQIPADIDAIPEPEAQKILRNKNAQYKRDRKIALINSKDVRKPEDLDNLRSYSWIKMTEPSLDALRLACRDPESRVRLSHEVNPTYYSRIDRIAVKRGYLEDLELDLSPNLNAVVGGRGTGTSSMNCGQARPNASAFSQRTTQTFPFSVTPSGSASCRKKEGGRNFSCSVRLTHHRSRISQRTYLREGRRLSTGGVRSMGYSKSHVFTQQIDEIGDDRWQHAGTFQRGENGGDADCG